MGESFTPGWLSLREPIDAASRSGEITRTIADLLPRSRPLRIVDLGTGTGSNLRYLIERLPPRQRWLLLDQDGDLLAEVYARTVEWAVPRAHRTQAVPAGLAITGDRLDCHLETRQVDLSALDPRLFAGQDLVTASALLDLVSDRWLRELATACAGNGTAALFALTYSGDSRCSPVEPEDERLREMMSLHQHGDKGFGPAAGAFATDYAADAFAKAGYLVRRARSDWTLTSENTDLQTQLFEGWFEAARAVAPEESPRWRDWLARRLAHVAAGQSTVMVGHEDLGAWKASSISDLAISDLPIDR